MKNGAFQKKRENNQTKKKQTKKQKVRTIFTALH